MKRAQSGTFSKRRYVIVFFVFLISLALSTHASKDVPSLPSTIESFIGIVIFVDYVSPGLEFVILTQERPGQKYPIDDIKNQCFETLWVSRLFEDGQTHDLIKIKNSLLEAFETRKQILVYGNYTKEISYTLGRADSYLRLTSFTIYSSNGYPHVQDRHIFEGVVGGVIGCLAVPVKKKKSN